MEVQKLSSEEIKAHKGFREKALKQKGVLWVENLATGFESYKEVIVAWDNSAGHQKNLLRELSYGCMQQVNGYWVFIGYKI